MASGCTFKYFLHLITSFPYYEYLIALSYHIRIMIAIFSVDNIIYLPGQPVGRLYPFRVLRKGVVLMYVTYSDLFTFVIMITGIISLIYQIHKK